MAASHAAASSEDRHAHSRFEGEIEEWKVFVHGGHNNHDALTTGETCDRRELNVKTALAAISFWHAVAVLLALIQVQELKFLPLRVLLIFLGEHAALSLYAFVMRVFFVNNKKAVQTYRIFAFVVLLILPINFSRSHNKFEKFKGFSSALYFIMYYGWYSCLLRDRIVAVLAEASLVAVAILAVEISYQRDALTLTYESTGMACFIFLLYTWVEEKSERKIMISSGGELASVESSSCLSDNDGTDSNQNAATVSLKVMMPELASVEQAEELVQSVTTGNLFKLVGNNDTKLHPDWNFDAFKFARETVTPLAMMAMHVMEARNLPSQLKLDRLKLARLLLTAERGYTPANPYHNAVHAANVVRTLYCILNAAQADAFSPAMEFAALLAAVMHDVGHPGRSNAFMVKRRKFSFVINEGDVNEQVSAMIMKIMLSMPELDIFQTKVHGEHLRTAILNLCIELILITSFARYSALTSRLEAILEDDGDHFCGAWGVMREDDFTNQEAISLLELALVCSDIGHVCDEWGVHEEWVARLTEEFHLEGDDVKLDGQKPAPFMDRDAGGFFNLQDGQVGFLENVALPLMRLVPRLFGEKVAPLVTRTEANKWKWQTLVEARRASEKHVSWASSNKEAK